MIKNKVELLAPAGNIEAFKGAIHAGADAVYLGGTKFGARAYADNFTTEELIGCIRYAHIFGRKVYLTVNTLMKDTEICELYDYLKPLYEAGLDAVIVQDLGVFHYIKHIFPEIELHVSTQMTITGEFGAAMLKNMGASRIVPARELSLKEIINMKEKTGLEIETFIHGAMCYSYSGQCLFSCILGGRSGNRGRCAQPCRLPYSVETRDNRLNECYPLSLKDMCTLEHIGKFIDAGIDSFKIEGRMKKPEYAAGVTAIYRKYIDKKLKHPDKDIKIDQKDWKNLTSLYIRSERQDGYYFKQNGADMVTMESPAYSGSDEELLKQIREKYIDAPLKRNISIYASFYCGSEVSVTFICDNASVTVTGEIMEAAKNQPLTEKAIEKQLCKLGDTCFHAETVEISTDGLGFYSLKAINELRREAVRALEDQVIAENELTVYRKSVNIEKDSILSGISKNPEVLLNKAEDKYYKSKETLIESSKNGWSVSVNTLEQLKEVISFLDENILTNKIFPISRVYLESELLLNYPELNLSSVNTEFYLALPYIMRKKDHNIMQKAIDLAAVNPYLNGILFRNLEEFQYLIEIGYKGKTVADAGVYVWNENTYQFWKDKTDMITCPLELNNREWLLLFQNRNVEKVVYGRLPMMVTANCISKTSGKCLHGKESSIVYLTDRYKKSFPVLVQCKYCTNIILNSVPLSLHNKENRKWYDLVTKRIEFTIENRYDTRRILDFFKDLSRNEAVEAPFHEYTTGHEKRGVE